ncbi:MAG: RNA pseudouridine synthase [Elusimicrobia bacterium]|nr:RNA pseudouridine synthase [Elusimicrobiota bacterium]
MNAPLKIVHEDDCLLAVDKPAGLPVIPARGQAPEPLVAVLAWQGWKLFVVHRLDRETSGLIVFAKDEQTHRRLCLAFENRQVRKSYLALVQGALEQGGDIDAPLKEFGSGRVAVSPDGKNSRTRYRVRERLRESTLLQVEPLTGRRHQIRAHLFSIGHPVLGDRLYGRPRPVGGVSRLMLHALALEIPGWPTLRAEPGPDFMGVLKARAMPEG